MYPEFDFSGVKVESRGANLSHSFSGLDALRHPEHGRIRDLKGYRKEMDCSFEEDWSNMRIDELANKIGFSVVQFNLD